MILDRITEILAENGLNNIEEINYKDKNIIVLSFLYTFDVDEIKAARQYSNDECGEESEKELWYEEYFLPYLNDLAIDNVSEILQDIVDEEVIMSKYIAYETEIDNYDDMEFIAVFADKSEDWDIDEILNDLQS